MPPPPTLAAAAPARPDDSRAYTAVRAVLTELQAAHGFSHVHPRVAMTDGHSRAHWSGRLHLNRGDVMSPTLRGVVAHEYGHLVDPYRWRSMAARLALTILAPVALAVALVSVVNAHPQQWWPPLLLAPAIATIAVLWATGCAITRRMELRVDAIATTLLRGHVDPLKAMFQDLPHDRWWHRAIADHPTAAERRAAVDRLATEIRDRNVPKGTP